MTAAPPRPGGIATRRFPIRVESRYSPVLRLFGVRPETAFVDLGTDLDARFGWSRITTPVSNITRWSIEGPWSPLTAIGVRRSIRHGDVTFGGSARGGVRVDFRAPPRYSIFRPPALYLTVEDVDGFVADLVARGIPGEDRRRR